jgi:hypothetical protein
VTAHPSLVQQTLSRVTVGPRQGDDRLAMYPLIDAAAPFAADYILARDAFAAGTFEVSETTESGQVPTLRVRNTGALAVLLLDGEELIGAKQNRVLNVTILVAAGAMLDVPVSCVERGRWGYRSRDFRDSDFMMDSGGRAAKMREVNTSLRTHGVRRSDQQAVWSRLDAKAEAMGARSDTAAMHDTFQAHRSALEDVLGKLAPVPHQVGAVFEVQGQARGVELFDAVEPFARVFPKVVRSYALDSLDRQVARSGRPHAADELIQAVARAAEERYPAVGLGEDVRLSSPEVQGGALAVAGRVLHLSALG